MKIVSPLLLLAYFYLIAYVVGLEYAVSVRSFVASSVCLRATKKLTMIATAEIAKLTTATTSEGCIAFLSFHLLANLFSGIFSLFRIVQASLLCSY